MQGMCRLGFSKYSISQDKWTVLPFLPFVSCAAGQIEYDNASNAVYYLVGNSKTNFYKYDLNTSTWSVLPDAPSTMTNGTSIRDINGDLYVQGEEDRCLHF